ncbi:MAG: J domain-containing protein [Kofleriaceae bacterium]|nr:J domain-containing protein [Kofleriaceae bacterium]
MTMVLLALADVGSAVQLEEQLNKAGLVARWDSRQVDGPVHGVGAAVVVIDGDHLGDKIADVAEKWRDQPSVPGVVAIGSSAAARESAPKARVALIAPTAKLSTLVNMIQEAAKLRLASGMRWAVLRAATNMLPVDDTPQAWQPTLQAARKVDIEIPRAALRWHAAHYVTPMPRLDELREERYLTVPELEFVRRIDGTTTVQTLVGSVNDAAGMARFLWTMGSMSALDFTPEVRDLATVPRRILHDMRTHLRARVQRLERSTYYDVLEVSPIAEYEEIENAYQWLGKRYAPNVLSQLDLSDLAPLVAPQWELVEKARSVLVDHSARGRYHDWLRQRIKELNTVWARDPHAVSAAADMYRRGQASLGQGDVHRAMSELAGACRLFPDHPDYEANLAWARYRVQVSSGRDRIETALVERKAVEDLMYGRRVWPRALLALALLCAAGGDADSARWHLSQALLAEPTMPAGVQLAKRLGMRR